MTMSTNTISVTACDNELVALAFTTTGSFELFRILSGNSMTVNVTFTITPGTYFGPIDLNGISNALGSSTAIPIPISLPSGTYNLQFIGLNWGDLQQFTVSINGGTAIGTRSSPVAGATR